MDSHVSDSSVRHSILYHLQILDELSEVSEDLYEYPC
jgi:hypothetical protein